MSRNDKFIDGILSEIGKVQPEDMEILKAKLGFTTTDMITVMGVHYTTYQRKFINKTTPINNLDRLFILLSSINMVRPMDYLAMRRSERSYWMGWRDAGGTIPEDVREEYTYELSCEFLDIEQYRRGVMESRETIRKGVGHGN